MAGAINPSSCKKDSINKRLSLPKFLQPIRRIFLSISLSPRYRRVREVWRKLNGYHFGVMCCAWTSAVVLVINLTATIWGIKKFGILDGLGTFQVGDCDSTSRLGFWLHLIINGLSTLLLGASNYSMQCLSSPTRREIDRAHRKCIWLDIGTPSVRNLRRISWSRIVLWWALAISSIPLHLFWNSAVLSTLYSPEYYVLVVPAGFPAGPAFGASFHGSISNNTYPVYNNTYPIYNNTYQKLASKASVLQRLEPRACLEAYVGSINSNRGDVVLVSSYNRTQVQPIYTGYLYDFIGPVAPGFQTIQGESINGPGQWICGLTGASGICDVQSAASNVSSWLFREFDVQYVRPSPKVLIPNKNMLMPNTASV